MKISNFIIVLLCFSFTWTSAYSDKKEASFAIVVDKDIMDNSENAIRKYASSVEADGLKTHIIIDIWNIPDSIREVLHTLYKTDNLEGAVFIGDIPIPMI